MTTQTPTTSSQKKLTSRTTTYLTIALLAIAFFCFATTTADALFSSPHHRRRQHHMLNDMLDMAGGLNHRRMYRPHAFAIDFDRIESRFEQIQRQHQAHMQQAFKNMQFAVNDDGLLHDVFNIDKLLNDMVAPPHHINNKKKQIQQQQQQQQKQQIPAPPATATVDNTTIVTPPVVQEQQNVTQQAVATNTTVNEYPRHVTYHVFGEFEVPAMPVEAPAATAPALVHDNSTTTTTATATATDVTPSADASIKPTAPVQDDLVVVDHDNEDQLSDDVIQELYGKEQDKEKEVAQSGDAINKAENSTAIATPTNQTKRFTKRHALSYTFQFTSPAGNVLEEDLAQWDAQVEKFVFEQNARLLKEHAAHPEDPVLELRYTRDVHDVTPQQIEYYKQQALYEQERKAAKEQAIARYNARQEQYKKNMEEYKKKEAKRQEELKKQQEELRQVEQELRALDEQKQKLLAKRNKVVNKPQLLRQNAVRYNRVPAFTPTFFMF